MDPDPDPSPSQPVDGDADQIPCSTDVTEEDRVRVLRLDDPVGREDTEEPESNGSMHKELRQASETEIGEEMPQQAQDLVEETVLASSEDVLGDSSHGALVWRESSERDGEEPPSPSSSGYAGERGSSMGSSGNDDIGDAENGFENPVDGIVWSTGRKHIGEVRPPEIRLDTSHLLIKGTKLQNSGCLEKSDACNSKLISHLPLFFVT